MQENTSDDVLRIASEFGPELDANNVATAIHKASQSKHPPRATPHGPSSCSHFSDVGIRHVIRHVVRRIVVGSAAAKEAKTGL